MFKLEIIFQNDQILDAPLICFPFTMLYFSSIFMVKSPFSSSGVGAEGAAFAAGLAALFALDAGASVIWC
jgi:hypothetical protein